MKMQFIMLLRISLLIKKLKKIVINQEKGTMIIFQRENQIYKCGSFNNGDITRMLNLKWYV